MTKEETSRSSMPMGKETPILSSQITHIPAIPIDIIDKKII